MAAEETEAIDASEIEPLELDPETERACGGVWIGAETVTGAGILPDMFLVVAMPGLFGDCGDTNKEDFWFSVA